jgi:hypothetical protein
MLNKFDNGTKIKKNLKKSSIIPYNFCRLHIDVNQTSILNYDEIKKDLYEWKRKKLIEGLEKFSFKTKLSGKPVSYKIEKIQYDKEIGLYMGKFVKLKQIEKTWDETNKKQIDKKQIDAENYINFFIQFESFILGFEKKSNITNIIKIFTDFFNKSSTEFSFSTDLLKDEIEVLDIINNKNILNCYINVQRTNPNPFGDAKLAEDLLDEFSGERIKLDVTNNFNKGDTKLNFEVGSRLRSFIALSVEAYGNFKLKYQESKNSKKNLFYDSEKNLHFEYAEELNDIDENVLVRKSSYLMMMKNIGKRKSFKNE